MREVFNYVANFFRSYLFLEKKFVFSSSEAELLKRITFNSRGKYSSKISRDGKILIKANHTFGSYSSFGNRGISAVVKLVTLDETKTQLEFRSRPVLALFFIPAFLTAAIYYEYESRGIESLWMLLIYVVNFIFWILFRYQENALLDNLMVAVNNN